MADAIGRSRVAVSNLLRLMQLGEAARELLEKRAIEMGHARALLLRGGQLVGVSVLDHILVAGGRWLSLRSARADLFTG